MSVGKWISILDRYMQIYLVREAKQYHLGPAQFNFLMLILQKDGVSQDYLCRKLNVDKTNATRILKRLERLEYIKRIPYEKDRRVNHVYATDKAHQIYDELILIRKQWTTLLTQNLSDKEQEVLFELLERITDNAIQYVEKGRK